MPRGERSAHETVRHDREMPSGRVGEPLHARPRLIHAGVKHYWRNGRGVVFDDTNLHEACNESDRARVVLFLDVERKLPWPLAWFHRLVVAVAYRAMPELRDMARVARCGAAPP